jgi:hypothetical protein
VDFCFRRVGKPVLAAGALALLTSFISAPVAMAQATCAAAAGTTKNYKDHDEYDLYSKITQTTDPKARLALLDTWQDKYPTSDFACERLQYFVVTLQQMAATDPTERQPLIDKCKEVLKTDPTNWKANYLIAVWGPAVGGASPAPDLLDTVQTAAKAAVASTDATFSDANKPKTLSADQWTQAKNQSLAIDHNALAWVAMMKKDPTTAEAEYRASLQANPEQGAVSAQLGKLLVDSKDDKKYPDALFEYARAGEYSGQAAVPADSRTKLMDYFNSAYKNYHGSADGADKVLDQAKTMALPPDGFTIGSAQAAANADAAKTQSRMDSDPGFKLWYTIESNLKGEQGDTFFNNTVKDAEIPGGAEGVKDFSGTVISVDPSKVTLGVTDPKVADTTILFTTPLRDSEVAKITVGSTMQFSGVAESYTKDPYMLTFKDPTIPGVQTSAPARTGHKRR